MRDYLISINKTDKEMQNMWDYCVKKGHKLISQLNKSGSSWSDLNTSALSTLEREYLKMLWEEHLEKIEILTESDPIRGWLPLNCIESEGKKNDNT